MSRLALRQRITDDIVAGILPSGAKLTIDELARRYGASHMPVREALRELSGTGLLEASESRTARVRRMDEALVENLFVTRGAIEAMMARRAAQCCAPSDLVLLRRTEEARLAAVKRRDYGAALDANQQFHEVINTVAGNAEAKGVLDNHWVLITTLWRQVGYGPERMGGVASDHHHLLRALATNDGDAAGVLMGAHVIKAKHDLLDRMPGTPITVGLALP